jgi:4-hydroxy-4-methyl-2-oxoglutarate aldolase
MDANKFETVIPAARSTTGLDTDQILAGPAAVGAQFGTNAKTRFQRNGK